MTVEQALTKWQEKDREYQKNGGKANELVDFMMKITHVWNNDVCRGYFTHALKDLFAKDQLDVLLKQLDISLNVLSENQAEEFYYKYFKGGVKNESKSIR